MNAYIYSPVWPLSAWRECEWKNRSCCGRDLAYPSYWNPWTSVSPSEDYSTMGTVIFIHIEIPPIPQNFFIQVELLHTNYLEIVYSINVYFQILKRSYHCFLKSKTCETHLPAQWVMRDEMREHESLISHDRLPCAQLCVIITGADPKQEASTERLNTGSQCNSVCFWW